MNIHTRLLVALFTIAAALCLIVVNVSSQSETLRRVTHTPPETFNLNPTLSGDGRRIVFESNADVASANSGHSFHAVAANLSSEPATYTELSATRAPAPAVSQDGSRVAFAAQDDPLGENLDGNSEIFFYDGAQLKQLTNSTAGDPSRRTTQGSFRPSISDDGKLIAFSSNRNLAAENADGNSEIYLFDTSASTLTQITNSIDEVGATDAKMSGDGSHVAFIHDGSSSGATTRDLVIREISSGASRTVVSAAEGLALPYGRAISDDGSRVVFAASTSTNAA